jgi:hypothetical protein
LKKYSDSQALDSRKVIFLRFCLHHSGRNPYFQGQWVSPTFAAFLVALLTPAFGSSLLKRLMLEVNDGPDARPPTSVLNAEFRNTTGFVPERTIACGLPQTYPGSIGFIMVALGIIVTAFLLAPKASAGESATAGARITIEIATINMQKPLIMLPLHTHSSFALFSIFDEVPFEAVPIAVQLEPNVKILTLRQMTRYSKLIINFVVSLQQASGLALIAPEPATLMLKYD